MTEIIKEKILVIEDDFDLAEMLANFFRVNGYLVDVANLGEDGVAMAEDGAPDVVLLDIRLPDIDGFEICRRLRQNRHTSDIPVLFLTEQRERSDRLAGLELGAVDYITKPFDNEELRLRVRNVLRRHKRKSLLNPITGLAEGRTVQQQLELMLLRPRWGVVIATVVGLTRFRDKYGFVAADDVARAVSLMISNALQENKAEDAYIGHLDAASFVILTTAELSEAVAASCQARLESSIKYFYPAIDRPTLKDLAPGERLYVEISTVSALDGEINNLDLLKEALARAA